jgi:hypothetical protein
LDGTTLPSNLDAAAVRWGGAWRMPTTYELSDLFINCDWVWENNGCRVYKYGSRNIDESIFLPAGGYKATSNGSTTIYLPNVCRYWTASLDGYYGNHGQEAMCLGADGESQLQDSVYRQYGLLVRPVYDEGSVARYLTVEPNSIAE